MGTTEIIAGLLGLVNLLLGFIINKLFNRVKSLESDIKELRKDMNDMRLNYLDRFDHAKDHRNEMKLEIIDKLNEISIWGGFHLSYPYLMITIVSCGKTWKVFFMFSYGF